MTASSIVLLGMFFAMLLIGHRFEACLQRIAVALEQLSKDDDE